MNRPAISIVAAMARNRVIGRGNRLPWHLPADLKRFKALTMGKPIVMGRRTWESLPGLLPGRRHIVVTGNPVYRAEGAEIAGSLEEALALAGDADEVMVVGGAQLYAHALGIANRIHLTLIEADIDGDAFFPELDTAHWRQTAREAHPPDDRNPWPYVFLEFVRSGAASAAAGAG